MIFFGRTVLKGVAVHRELRQADSARSAQLLSYYQPRGGPGLALAQKEQLERQVRQPLNYRGSSKLLPQLLGAELLQNRLSQAALTIWLCQTLHLPAALSLIDTARCCIHNSVVPWLSLSRRMACHSLYEA
jgi:hypothetical protein